VIGWVFVEVASDGEEQIGARTQFCSKGKGRGFKKEA